MNVPSGYTALDLIGFTDRGDYVSTDNYVKNDLVHYNGRVWKCLIDDTIGITPVEGANWTVWIDEAAYLSGLADVTITNPANGQVIRYNSQSGKWENVGVDSTPTSGSANLVQSGGVATQLANKANSADLATVATSGDYQDLNNLPTLADVATTGQYSDLLGLPTIPTVNNGTLTLQINGITVETFNANDSNNKTANFNVPTKTSDLTNDSNFVSDANYQHITVDSAFSDSSTNPVQNKVVNSLKETLTQQINENGVKNVIPFPYSDGYIKSGNYGVSYTVDEDGAVIANGTSTGDSSFYLFTALKGSDIQYMNGMVLSGISDGDNNLFISVFKNSSPYTSYAQAKTTGVVISGIPNDSTRVSCLIRVGNGKVVTNKKFYPMICPKSVYDLDPTYAPPSKTNQQLTEDSVSWSDEAQIGTVNVLNNTATTQTVGSEVTYTVNADKTITATFSASPTSNREIDVCGAFTLDKLMKLSGCPSGGNNSNGYRSFARTTGGTYYVDIGDGIYLPAGSYSYVRIAIGTGVSASSSPLTFKPMITPVSYNGPYVPYAKSNKELTEDVEDLTNQFNNHRKVLGSTNIFDILSTYNNGTYVLEAQNASNGSSNLYTLLSLGSSSAVVVIEKYDAWRIAICVYDGNHSFCWATCNKNATSLYFIKIDADNAGAVSKITVSKATT